MKKLLRLSVVTVIGGVGYSFMEILFRNRTHWSMTVTGGMCFGVLYWIHTSFSKRPLWVRALGGGALITAAELAVGLLVNRRLGWNVWDYSGMAYHLWGQICLPFSLLWIALAAAASPLCRRLKAALDHVLLSKKTECVK